MNTNSAAGRPHVLAAMPVVFLLWIMPRYALTQQNSPVVVKSDENVYRIEATPGRVPLRKVVTDLIAATKPDFGVQFRDDADAILVRLRSREYRGANAHSLFWQVLSEKLGFQCEHNRATNRCVVGRYPRLPERSKLPAPWPEETPKDGITGGYVLAYGRYVRAPYRVVDIDGLLRINGIRIFPPLRRPSGPDERRKATNRVADEIASRFASWAEEMPREDASKRLVQWLKQDQRVVSAEEVVPGHAISLKLRGSEAVFTVTLNTKQEQEASRKRLQRIWNKKVAEYSVNIRRVLTE